MHFHNDQLGPWYEKICKLSGKEMALPMNTGAEAVETAIKAARRWAYDVKGVQKTKQKLLRVTATSMVVQWELFHYHLMLNINVDLDQCFQGLNLFLTVILEALEAAITPNTAAFLDRTNSR